MHRGIHMLQLRRLIRWWGIQSIVVGLGAAGHAGAAGLESRSVFYGS